jgi:hypothetical protein
MCCAYKIAEIEVEKKVFSEFETWLAKADAAFDKFSKIRHFEDQKDWGDKRAPVQPHQVSSALFAVLAKVKGKKLGNGWSVKHSQQISSFSLHKKSPHIGKFGGKYEGDSMCLIGAE